MTGLVVGGLVLASIALLLLIVIAPFRKVRDEPPLDRDIETELLLGRVPSVDAEPAAESPAAPPELSAADVQALRRLSSKPPRRSRR